MRIERVLVTRGSEFRIVGELDDASCRQLERMLASPASDGGVVTLDLSELQSCDAAGIDVLVNLTKRADIASGALLLRSVTDDVLQAFMGFDALAKLHVKPLSGDTEPRAHAPRYLYRAGERTPFAFASSRRDFSLLNTVGVWAHESHGWLIEAGSGAVLAHRTRASYFSVDSEVCLYSEQPAADSEQ